ncbi:hypothetical protein BZG36_01991 [Bifiguratus adelaidae]|uniref:RecA family profile 1 domain-containing protein n=1 Tax=Bifiguratus adelaidae TaxID=1938954 RepID=A0A261Y432_9FUNG|nr:hypothetical protein BZG36_01991 [Bifiguratus adelaidae]
MDWATISRLDVRPRIHSALQQSTYESLGQILQAPSLELQKRLKLSSLEVSELETAVCEVIYNVRSRRQTAAELQNLQRFLSTGDPACDALLSGGIPTRGITEIVGESSSGKTQLLLQLCCIAQLPTNKGGLGGGVAFLHTEGKFPIPRLTQLLTRYKDDFPPQFDPSAHVHYVNLVDTETLYHIVFYQLPIIIERQQIKLVIIDSIAALYRGEHFDQDTKGRLSQRKELCDISVQLRTLSEQYGIPIVCSNQVSDALLDNEATSILDAYEQWLPTVETDISDIELEPFVASLSKVPTLGFLWSNSINVRIRLARGHRTEELMKARRLMCVEFAPHAGKGCVEFEIYDLGLRAVSSTSETSDDVPSL